MNMRSLRRVKICFENVHAVQIERMFGDEFVLILLIFLNVFSGNYASRLTEKESAGYVPLTTEEIFEKYDIQM